MEVLNLIRLFCGWVFHYISYIRLTGEMEVPEMFGDNMAPKNTRTYFFSLVYLVLLFLSRVLFVSLWEALLVSCCLS